MQHKKATLRGTPNAPVNQLVGMLIFKEGFGFSDGQLFVACWFHLLVWQALELVNLNDPPHTESNNYLFRKLIFEYVREHGADLLGQFFEAITSDHLLTFDLGGQQITGDSVQPPDDPECSYRRKAGQTVKGYTVNLTETIDEQQELNLITNVHLAPADSSDADMLDPAIEATEQRTGRPVDKCYADGVYNRILEKEG